MPRTPQEPRDEKLGRFRRGGVLLAAFALVATVALIANPSGPEQVGADETPADDAADPPVVAAADAPELPPDRTPAFDVNSLDSTPIKQWGVEGIGNTYSAAKVHVWDFEEIGDRIYVGGAFTHVRRDGDDPSSQKISRAYLAAFDRDSGEWISTFTPTFNRAVYALEKTSDGHLLVGGEFTTVNGQSRTGLVKINAETGATMSGFPTYITANNQPMVRELVRDGDQVYAVGQISTVYAPNGAPWVWNAFRFNESTGAIDLNWLPKYAGGVWDIALDHDRNRVHAAGFFTSTNGTANTARMSSVSMANGASIPGLSAFVNNDPNQRDTVAIAYSNNRIYVGGSQHILQVLDADTNARIGFNTTGLHCTTFTSISACGYSAGGDYQVLEVTADDKILAGCHCFHTYTTGSPIYKKTHYSSFSGQRTDNRFAIVYNGDDSKVTSSFVPGLKEDYYGTYSLFTDTRGCYYVGGYYTRSEAGKWVGGFGRFCAPVKAPTGLTASTVNGGVTVNWDAQNSPLPAKYYKVYRNGTFAGDTTGTTFGFPGLTPGSTQQITVRTMDVAGRLSGEVSVTVTVADPDTEAPTTPGNLTGALNGDDVTLTWDASTDLPANGSSGLSGYLVHRDWEFVKFIPAGTTTWVDEDVALGTHRYEVRAVDRANNMSQPATVTVTRGIVDNEPPTVPTNVVASPTANSVTLTWNPSTDLPNPGGVGLSGYLIHRDWEFIKFVPAGTQTFTDTGVTPGNHRYEVRSVDLGNRMSEPTVVNTTVGDPDTQAPTIPASVASSVNGSTVTLTWNASTDLPNPGGVGLSGYLIHRDWEFITYIPAGTQTFVDNNVASGNHRYEVRSVDRNNNMSEPTVLTVTVP